MVFYTFYIKYLSKFSPLFCSSLLPIVYKKTIIELEIDLPRLQHATLGYMSLTFGCDIWNKVHYHFSSLFFINLLYTFVQCKVRLALVHYLNQITMENEIAKSAKRNANCYYTRTSNLHSPFLYQFIFPYSKS